MITKIAILQQSCIVALHLWNSLKQQEQKICKSLKIRIPESNLNLFIDKGGNILSIKGSETMFPCISLLSNYILVFFNVFAGYHQKDRKPVSMASPIDQLFPISKKLVENVQETLRNIVQKTIQRCLSKFPTLKTAVEAKVVNKIFETKRDQTIQFIRQFLEMQKKSIDVVFAPIPTPDEIDQWKSQKLTTREGLSTTHPCMTSKTMNHMEHLAEKLYPRHLVTEIEGHGSSSAHTAFVNHKVSI